ncbi:MAG: RIP metalloprotease RseP [Rhodoferax sp.]|nr:RIP metalloprotease RseP [Rhodoferax sp.]
MTTVLAFIFAIAILIAVHEWGHYAVAVACGVKVLRFSIGFGPALWSWTSPRSGTEFALCALPLGGYVKMLDEREGPVSPEERHRAFNTQALKFRAVIVAAGPLANLILAVLLYSLVHWVGIQQWDAVLPRPLDDSVAMRAGFEGGERVVSVGTAADQLEAVRSYEEFRWWLTESALDGRDLYVGFMPRDSSPERTEPQRVQTLPLGQLDVREADATLFRTIGWLGPYSPARMGMIYPDGAAAFAGLQAGDMVLNVDGQAIVDSTQLRELIRVSAVLGPAAAQRWLIDRGGQQLVLSLTPSRVPSDSGFSGRINAMVGEAPESSWVRYGPLEGVVRAVGRTWDVSALTLSMMGKIVLGQASFKNLSGPITIADYAGKSAALGWQQYLVFLALISISLGVLNLLPIPVLDGGHLMYYLWEFVTGKAVTDLWLGYLQRAGVAVLMVMMSIAVFNDVVQLLN